MGFADDHSVDSVPPEPFPGDIFRDASSVQVALDASSVQVAAEMGVLEDFLEDVDLSVRKKVVDQFAGLHLHLPFDHPKLTGVLLGGGSYLILENDMLIVSIIL